MVPAIIAGAVAAGTIASNLYNSSKDREAREAARKQLATDQSLANQDYKDILDSINTYYYKDRGSLGTAQDVKDYKAAMAAYDPNSFVYNRGKFENEYNKTASDFINPLRDKIIANEIAGVQHSAAGAGLGRGSGAAEAIAQAVADKDEELYRLAQEDYRDDRDFAYRKYSDYANAMQQKLDTLRAATDTKMTLQGNLAQDYYNVMDSAQADRLKLNQDKIATNASYAQAMAGLV